MVNQAPSIGCMKTLWQYFQADEEDAHNYDKAFSSAENVNWLIANRGGMGAATGLTMPPPQLSGPDLRESERILKSIQGQKEEFTLNYKETDVSGLIYYPNNYNHNQKKCILYHNPIGITFAGFFEQGRLAYTAGKIAELRNCPIMLYDYRGTGLSQQENAFHPTYESVVEDGQKALSQALAKFETIEVWGSSLGGGVAAISLSRHLAHNERETSRITLFNHDSFSNTARLSASNQFKLANLFSFHHTSHLEAETAMKDLIAKKVKITVLQHQNDPVISPGARMADFITPLLTSNLHVSLISSSKYGHANLTEDMIQKLRSCN